MNLLGFRITRGVEKKELSESSKVLLTLSRIMFIGLLGTIIYSLQASSIAEFVSYSTIGLMVSGASMVLGGLLGFLFGIPKTLQDDRTFESMSNKVNTTTEDGDRVINYGANTNLEQISDWLTKILVGVGLTQIPGIIRNLKTISIFVSSGLGNSEASQIFALAIILFFMICGFLFGFLWTRLFLPGAFKQADLSTLAKDVKDVNRKMQELEKQSEQDAKALSLVQRQLNPSNDIPDVTQDQLNEAIRASSRPVKMQIFIQAENLRRENWKDDKPKMELTIPILKALIESDDKNEFHRNHGQLGYALKDMKSPDWIGAEAELTKAIELRGSKNTWLLYEFVRAICKINLDKEFAEKKVSKPESRDSILSDLRAAERAKLSEWFSNNPEIEEWMKLNNVEIKDLR